MHGLINRSLQCFLRDTYGASRWTAISREARLGFDSFEPMLTYPTEQTDAVLDAAVKVLDRPREALLEDLGTYLVAHKNLEALRRLLRFGGVSFHDFLHSLEDMRGRGQLALPDMDLPKLELFEQTPDYFTLRCEFPVKGVGHMLMGLLRSMADDYGALVLLDYLGSGPSGEIVSIQLLEARFAEGRRFDLTARVS
ncbi:MAG: hypothetical protein ACJASV_002370 [Pseudorhodobacter sp.]|jgi:hypothetical protein